MECDTERTREWKRLMCNVMEKTFETKRKKG